jgi:hypothetical protein
MNEQLRAEAFAARDGEFIVAGDEVAVDWIRRKGYAHGRRARPTPVIRDRTSRPRPQDPAGDLREVTEVLVERQWLLHQHATFGESIRHIIDVVRRGEACPGPVSCAAGPRRATPSASTDDLIAAS